IRAILSGEAVDFEGREYAAHVPPLRPDAEAPREPVPLYVAGTGPKMQRMAGEVADGLLTPSITTPGFVRYARDNLRAGAEAAGVTGEVLDKTRPVAGTPDDCIRAVEEYRDAGCTHIMLELWGEQRDRQIQLFADSVLSHFRR